MSKHYGRAHTPPSPPALPPYRATSGHTHSSKSYQGSSSKSSSYASKEYSDRSLSNKYDKKEKYSQYDKYSKYDNYEDKYVKAGKLDKHSSHYDKGDSSSRYDKYEKSNYKQSYSSSKDYGDSLYSTKKSKPPKYERQEKIRSPSYKSKNASNYSSASSSFLDRNSYSKKYSSRNNDYPLKYSPHDLHEAPNDKYTNRTSISLHYTENGKKYDSYSSKTTSFPKSYRSLDDPYYDPDVSAYDSYGSYKDKSEISRKLHYDERGYGTTALKLSSKDYSHQEYSSNSDSYQRYVIGDSVVYGSPGHNPEDLYPSSPKLKRKSSTSHNSLSPAKESKGYSRYSPSSSKRFKDSSKLPSSTLRSSYTGRSKSPRRTSSRSSFCKPLSPLLHRSYSPQVGYTHGKSSKSFSSSDIHHRTKSSRDPYSKLEDDYDIQTRSNDTRRKPMINRMRERGLNDSSRSNQRPLLRRSENQDLRGVNLRQGLVGAKNRFISNSNSFPRPSSPPKPLLSIRLSDSILPKKSRERYRETISHKDNLAPTLPFCERGGLLRKRLEARRRVMQSSTLGQRRRAASPGTDRRRRRPDDLRLWIESRKSVGKKKNGSPSGRISGRSLLTKSSTGGKEVPASQRMRALLESKKRLLAKNRSKALPSKKLPLRKSRKPLSSQRSRERETSQGVKRQRGSLKEEQKGSSHQRVKASSLEGSYKHDSSPGQTPRSEKTICDRKDNLIPKGSLHRKIDSKSSDSKVKSKSKVLSASRKGLKRTSQKAISGSRLVKKKSEKVRVLLSPKKEPSEMVDKSSKQSTSRDDEEYLSPMENTLIKEEPFDLYFVEDQVPTSVGGQSINGQWGKYEMEERSVKGHV